MRQDIKITIACTAGIFLLILYVFSGISVSWGDAPQTSEKQPAHRIQPGDLVYQGAFRLPDGPDEFAWGWSGEALAYRPNGDPKGPADSHPGSLFGTGHNWNQHVSEISIPKPVLSKTKSLDDLPTAKTIQPFANIRGTLFRDMEQPRAGLAYLPKQGKQTRGKLYFCFAPHLDEIATKPSHGWCETTLQTPAPKGPWKIARQKNYVTTDYLLPIDPLWAKTHTPGKCLATGRYRDGGQIAMGPALFAIAPWQEGNPPKPNASLKATCLLAYDSITHPKPRKQLKNYHHSDGWSGAAWLSAGAGKQQKTATIFVGTKGVGKCWYGYGNGLVWPEEPPFPAVPAAPNDDRGWWSTQFKAQILFYDPADLAKVASGKIKPNEPQPYATMDIDAVLLGLKSKRQGAHVGAAAFDRQRALLYIVEPRADGDKSLIHVWKISPARKKTSPSKKTPSPTTKGNE